MRVAYRKAAGDKAAANGLQRSYIDTRATKAECEDYLERDIWSQEWPDPAPMKTATPVDEYTIPFSFAEPEDAITSELVGVEPSHEAEAGTNAYEPAMVFSTFPNKAKPKAKRVTLSRETFIGFLSKHHVRTKKDGPLFSPATFRARRCNEDFIEAHGICLDFDHGAPNPDKVVEVFPDTLLAYYSTHSHTRASQRFRVVLPLSRPVNAADHAALVHGVKSVLPRDLMECLDATCFERARSHYLPSCPPAAKRDAFTGHQSGTLLDVEHYLALGAGALEPVLKAPAQVTARPRTPPDSFEFYDPNNGELLLDLRSWAAQNREFSILSAIPSQYRRGSLRNGKQHIVCPFQHEHSDQSLDLATFAADALPPEFEAWAIHCCHAHCVDRDRLEFLFAMLQKGWIAIDQLQESRRLTLRRPPKVYFPVNDILSAPEWSSLRAEERRIGYDLMAMMWAEEDGRIDDDDWKIARRLNVLESEWIVHRETLTRAGWLVQSEGKLANLIVKREFDNAQAAYMRVIQKASNGGKTAQEKKRAPSHLQVAA